MGKHGAVGGNQGLPGVGLIDLKEEMTFEQRLKDKGASHSRLQCEKGNTLCSGYFMENSSQKKCRECWEPQRLERRSQHLQSIASASLPSPMWLSVSVCLHLCIMSVVSLLFHSISLGSFSPLACGFSKSGYWGINSVSSTYKQYNPWQVICPSNALVSSCILWWEH